MVSVTSMSLAKLPKSGFENLKGLIEFIANDHLVEFVTDVLNIAREVDLPLLSKLKAYSDEQLVELSVASHKLLFDAIINDGLETYINATVQRWQQNELGLIDKTEIAGEDPALYNNVRKRALLKYLWIYTVNDELRFIILHEIDELLYRLTKAFNETYINVLYERISEELHFNEKITQTLPGVVYIFDLIEQKLIYSNKKTIEILGVTVEDIGITPDILSEILHPQDIDHARNRSAELIELSPGDITSWEYRIKDRAGNYRWMRNYEATFKTDSAGKTSQIIGFALDITETVEMYKALQQSESALIDAQEISGVGNYEWVMGTKDLKGSLQFKKIFEWDGRVEDIDLKSKIHPDDLKHVEDEILKAMSTSDNFDCEYRINTQKGEKFVWSRGKVSHQDGKKVLIGTLMDLTQRNRLLRELAQVNKDLRVSNANLEEFAFVASHDLKEPLRKIITFGGRLYDVKEKLPETHQSYLERMIASTGRMQTLINDLLALSLVTRSKEFHIVSLQTLFDDAKSVLEHKIDERNARITTSDLPDLRVSAAQIRQLFQNLLANSLKFAKADVAPIISVTHSYIWKAETDMDPVKGKKQYLRIIYSDNGIGFEDVYVDKIFMMFQRLHSKGEYEGNGMGLAICRRIVENHNGTITATGKLGVGATFTIDLAVD